MDAQAVGTGRRSQRLAVLLMGGALLGKMTGLLRELLLARLFGTSPVADSFRGSITATLIPISPLQNEGVPGVLVPLYRDWLATGEGPKRFAALCVGLGLVSLLVTGLVVALAGPWVGLLLGGLEADTLATARRFTIVMALGMPGSVLLNCFSAAEIATGRSRMQALRPVCVNVAVMAGLAAFLATGALWMLPASYMLGLNGLALWGLVMLDREGIIRFRDVDAGSVVTTCRIFFRRLKPFLVLPLGDQVWAFVERRVASTLSGGTIAAIDYARTLTESAVLLISQPLGFALLHAGVSADPKQQIARIARSMLAVALPASVVLWVLAPDVVRLLFMRGAFDEADAALTATAVRGIACGLWGSMLGWVLVRILNGLNRNSAVIKMVCASYAVNAMIDGCALLVPSPYGMAVLGFGEAARGIFFLGAVTAALGWLPQLLLTLLRALPVVVAVAVLAPHIASVASHAVPRLALGGLLSLAASALLLFVLDREIFWRVVAAGRGRLLKLLPAGSERS